MRSVLYTALVEGFLVIWSMVLRLRLHRRSKSVLTQKLKTRHQVAGDGDLTMNSSHQGIHLDQYYDSGLSPATATKCSLAGYFIPVLYRPYFREGLACKFLQLTSHEKEKPMWQDSPNRTSDQNDAHQVRLHYTIFHHWWDGYG